MKKMILHAFFVVTGEVISERDRCTQCKGNKVVQEKKVLQVRVDKGMKHGQKIVYPGEADEAVSYILAFVTTDDAIYLS